jgi:hypothetical protein
MEALIAIGALALIAVAGWLVAARASARVGKLEMKIKTFEDGIDARERQVQAEVDHARRGDFADDADVMSQLADGEAKGLHPEE